MLGKVGRDVAALECGAHAPSHRRSAEALVRAGMRPSPLHNNCSGKHAGFICLACHERRDPFGYVASGHPVMREVMGAVSEMSGAAMSEEEIATDGCSIPTQPAPLTGLATGFARLCTGLHLGPERAKAAARLLRAAAAHPFMIAGSGRFDTDVMSVLGARAFVKTGAEGVYCAAFPELGYGVALKADDGTTRASEAMMAAVIAKLLPLSDEERRALGPRLEPRITNWNGIETGRVRTVGPLALAPT
jgi:L-asparaginase II